MSFPQTSSSLAVHESTAQSTVPVISFGVLLMCIHMQVAPIKSRPKSICMRSYQHHHSSLSVLICRMGPRHERPVRWRAASRWCTSLCIYHHCWSLPQSNPTLEDRLLAVATCSLNKEAAKRQRNHRAQHMHPVWNRLENKMELNTVSSSFELRRTQLEARCWPRDSCRQGVY